VSNIQHALLDRLLGVGFPSDLGADFAVYEMHGAISHSQSASR